jgi:threonine dehydrogenase-like Zn-dependent dehydrogenase
MSWRIRARRDRRDLIDLLGLGACCGALADFLGANVVGVARAGTLERLRVVPLWLGHRMVRTGGRMVTVGAHAGRQCPLDLWRLFTREQDLRGSHGCHRADMEHAIAALGGLDETHLVDSVFEIADHRAAYARLDTPGRFGNVLIAIGEDQIWRSALASSD